MRVTHINATLNLGKEASQFENLERILAQFEDFCTVSQSVQAGIPITIRVEDSRMSAKRRFTDLHHIICRCAYDDGIVYDFGGYSFVKTY